MKLGATLARCLQTDTQVELCKIEHAAAIVSATPAPVDSWTTVACAVPVIESCSTVLPTLVVVVVLAVEHARPHYPDLQLTGSRP
jgi:hypothetical protein